jgi:putative copper export protein
MWAEMAGVIVVLGAMLTVPLSGHPEIGSLAGIDVIAGTIHIAAAGAWLGGLVILVGVARPATQSLSKAARVRTLAPVVSRFSVLALLSVSALVATGVYRSWAQVRTLEALTGDPYGIVLLAKLAAFVPVVALGAINNRWTVPQLRRSAEATASNGAPLRRLRRLVMVEIGLGTLVLAISAALANLPPPAT